MLYLCRFFGCLFGILLPWFSFAGYFGTFRVLVGCNLVFILIRRFYAGICFGAFALTCVDCLLHWFAVVGTFCLSWWFVFGDLFCF